MKSGEQKKGDENLDWQVFFPLPHSLENKTWKIQLFRAVLAYCKIAHIFGSKNYWQAVFSSFFTARKNKFGSVRA